MIELVFIFFSLLAIGTAVGVVVCRNPIYSAFCLVHCFFSLAAIYILWNATLAGVLQVLIYTGAIVVLFAFVVMLLPSGKLLPSFSGGYLFVGIIGVTVWSIALLGLRSINRGQFVAAAPNAKMTLRAISKLLFTDYLWAFEILSVFLLALTIAVYVLSRPEKEAT